MTWSFLPPIPQPTAIAEPNPSWILTADPSSPDTVYALNALDVLQSRDGGFSSTPARAEMAAQTTNAEMIRNLMRFPMDSLF